MSQVPRPQCRLNACGHLRAALQRCIHGRQHAMISRLPEDFIPLQSACEHVKNFRIIHAARAQQLECEIIAKLRSDYQPWRPRQRVTL